MKVYPNPNARAFRYDDGEESGFKLYTLTRREMLKLTDHRYLHILGRASGGVEQTELLEWAIAEFDLAKRAAIYLCKNLSKRGLLVTEDELTAIEREAETWRQSGWGPALDYYRTTLDRDYDEHVDASESWHDRIEENDQREREQPKPYKRYDEAATVELDEPTGERLGPFSDAIERDRPECEPSRDRRMTKADLSAALYYTFGEMERHEIPTGEYLLKTSPSAGARHPTEAYVAAVDVEGLETGVYHYSVEDHSLDVIEESVGPLLEATCGRDADIDLLVVCSSVVYRNMMKYPSPETFQMVNHDVGHLMETLRLAAGSLGLGSRFSDRLRAEDAAAVLSLDPFEEPIFGYATLRSGE